MILRPLDPYVITKGQVEPFPMPMPDGRTVYVHAGKQSEFCFRLPMENEPMNDELAVEYLIHPRAFSLGPKP